MPTAWNFGILLPTLALSSFLIAGGNASAADQTTSASPLRPPAVPLVVHDPYFSIWSPGDNLNEQGTVHWTGKTHALSCTVKIDEQEYLAAGTGWAGPKLEQKSLMVLPTRTIYKFEGAGVALTLTFMTPALPEDIEILSRPVTYVSFEFHSTDGNTHEVIPFFDAHSAIAVNEGSQEVVVSKLDSNDGSGLCRVKIGSRVQPILAKKGDDLRIDWGYFYIAGPQRTMVAEYSALNADKESTASLPVPTDPAAVLTIVAKSAYAYVKSNRPIKVSSQTVSCWLMLAYDDEYSIKYFGQNLRPYWRRNGDGAAELLKKAAADYESLIKRCAAFDERLMADLRKVGGDKYAALCALAYRQTFAGNKLAADANGAPLLFPKENFSNGCISTVDVLFPQAPFFLTFSPALTKAMLIPVLDYASSPLWPYNYAPHDLGTYPWAMGQVYGMRGGDGGRMPVEESGNMLIMLAALARIEGNADLAKKYWPLMTKWADYLVANGLDPENQLCSADMFGHLPHCANLALKAIIGIGGYAQLCEAAGKTDDAKKYMAIARDYAAKWQEKARDEGRTRLAYHLPGTWGMKHNLIWDRVLGLNLFPDSVGNAEIAWYLKVQNKYGLPVDNRTSTSLIDWAMWSIAPARDRKDFEALVEPIFRYANETPSRVPLSDWFNTTDAKQKGFQARPVVGGIFIKLLTDAPQWAQRAAKTTETWAPFPEMKPSVLKEIVPTAQKQAVTWRYTLEKPGDDWFKPDFNDSAWKQAPAGFGAKGTPGAVVRTEWKTKDIWLRREFTLPDAPLKNPVLLMHYDETPDVYINGVLAAKLDGYVTDYEEIAISPAARATLKPGRNVFAIHCRQTTGGQYIDAGLADSAPAEPTTSTTSTGSTKSTSKAASVAPPPNLRKLMDTPLRDPSICRGPDGTYYLTGTSEPFWGFNNENGIRIWKSKDLQTWEALGTVWRYGSSPWHKKYLEAKKPLWAPEIHYKKGTFWLTYSMPGWDGTGKTSGSGLLKSTTGKPEGPYEDMQPNERLGDEIDASLFEDDDGAMYFLWHSGKIARLKTDMSGLAEPYHWLKTSTTDPDPKHHAGLCAGIFGKDSYDHVGYEGMFMFKREGRYYLCCSENFEGRYSCAIATATSIYGPYSARYEAIPHGGHNTFFQDQKGQWWSTYFGAPWKERAAILPVEFAQDDRVRPLAAAAESAAVTAEAAALPADLKPLFDFPVRDTCVCVGGDGNYYLSGTTGHPTWWNTNEGIRLWKSADLKKWEPLGLVWTFDKDGTWQKQTVKGKRAIWAPEIHYIKNTYWIAYCVNYSGTGLLKSTSGKPEGPYVDVKPDGPLTGEIDASIFGDDDGKIYWVYQNGKIARMKDDLSGLAEEPRLLKPEGDKHVGFEGAFLTKMNGRYVLLCADFIGGMYHCMVAESDAIYGPYGKRYLAVPHGGHNTFFKDKEGKWWSTFFGNDAKSPFRERPAILRIERDSDGKVHPMKN